MFDVHAIHAAAYSVAVDGETFRFLESNRAALALSGVTAAFQPGLTPQDVFPPETAAHLVERYRACCAGEAVSYATTVTVGAALRDWQTPLFPVAGPDGRPALI